MSALPDQIKIVYLIALAIAILFVSFIIVFLAIYKNKQTVMYNENLMQEALLKQQKLEAELEKMIALQSERDRISSDMHDDLGSGLSSIKLISEMLKRKYHDRETQQDLNEIVVQATDLTSTMRDLVWSLNPRNDQLEKFITDVQQYIKHFLEPSTIHCQMDIPKHIPDITISGYIRRNLMLCIKEILNNMIKHSKSSEVKIHVWLHETQLKICIEDNGIGIDGNTQANNGFYNLDKRMKDCSGMLFRENMASGLKTTLEVTLS